MDAPDLPAAEPPEAGSEPDFAWHVTARLAEIEGEGRANALRAIGVLLFYGVELVAYHGLTVGSWSFSYPRSVEEHRILSLLAGAWALLAVAVQALVRRRFVPPGLKFATTAGDLALLTGLLAVSEGPRSPAIVAYLLIVGLAALRLNLQLVRFATAGAALGWLLLLGIARQTGSERIPRYHQAVFLLAILFLGVMLSQAIRRGRKVAEEYAERRDDAEGGPP